MDKSKLIKQLKAELITSENFQPYGQVIYPTQDGKPYNSEDAQLILQSGIPRFYIMHLAQRGRKFDQITRHSKCTQCLGSLAGKEWLIAVAPPLNLAKPKLEEISAFRISGHCFIKLNLGTWHAGPYFEDELIDFYNLELSDTNINDHETCNLLESNGTEFEII